VDDGEGVLPVKELKDASGAVDLFKVYWKEVKDGWESFNQELKMCMEEPEEEQAKGAAQWVIYLNEKKSSLGKYLDRIECMKKEAEELSKFFGESGLDSLVEFFQDWTEFGTKFYNFVREKMLAEKRAETARIKEVREKEVQLLKGEKKKFKRTAAIKKRERTKRRPT